MCRRFDSASGHHKNRLRRLFFYLMPSSIIKPIPVDKTSHNFQFHSVIKLRPFPLIETSFVFDIQNEGRLKPFRRLHPTKETHEHHRPHPPARHGARPADRTALPRRLHPPQPSLPPRMTKAVPAGRLHAPKPLELGADVSVAKSIHQEIVN